MTGKSMTRQVKIAAGQNIKEYEYWKRKLSGEPVTSIFPFDFKEPGSKQVNMGSKTFRFSGEIYAGLKKLSKGSAHTLHIILLAALTALLNKYTGNDDILIGTPIYRQETEAEFINTMLVLRNRLHARLTFKELLMQVRQTVVEAVEHQAYPVELLPYKLDIPVPETGFAEDFPLFDVVLFLPDIHDKTYIRGITPNIIFSFRGGSQYVQGEVEYNVSRYLEATLRRIIGHFTRLLQNAVVEPDLMLCDIEILSGEEQKQLLFDFNDTDAKYPKDKTLRQLFEEQAEKKPDKIAVVYENKRSTYTELNEKANRLARILIKKGVEADSIVGIMEERSIEMIAGFLGILKAGGAYLPIDIHNPQERISGILTDSGTRVLLTTRLLFKGDAKIGKWEGEVIFTERSATAAHDIDKGFSIRKQSSTSLAYVIYTSGTTGRPKGVLIAHRGVVNLIHYHEKVFSGEKRTRRSQVANPGFDAMAFETWPCLTSGAALFIAAENDRMHPGKMKDWLIKQEITLSFQPTLIAEQLLKERWPAQGVALRILQAAGDRLTTYPARSYPFRLYNLYGPTESTVWTTWAEVKIKNAANGPCPVIGKPVGNLRVYIMAADLRILPIGVAGELCIMGDGVAPGYLNRPELTAEKFVTAPAASFKPQAHELSMQSPQAVHVSHKPYTSYLYKTGDLARWLPGGDIEFIGRIDHQVKIRGFRIELGEIEDILQRHNEIKDAVVIEWEKEPGQKSLCAYIVPVNEISGADVRDYLAKELPTYMIPPYVTTLSNIPLTSNGKLDRNKLPPPKLNIVGDYVAPRDDNEKLVADIWKEVLGLEKVGIHHSFFDLGGNSIDFITLNSKIKDELKMDIPLMEMFRYPTIAAFVRYLSEENYSRIIDRSTEKKLGTSRLEKMRNMKRRG